MLCRSQVVLCLVAAVALLGCSNSSPVATADPTLAGSAAPATSGSGGQPASGAAAAGAPARGGPASMGARAAGSGAQEPSGEPNAEGGEDDRTQGSAGAGSEESEPSGDAPAPGGEGDSFEACVAALRPQCAYEDSETACSSLMTPVIPLTSGESWGNIEMQAGPYGGFVEWNEGMDFANPINESESSCDILAATFAEPQSVTDDVLDLRGADLSLYTVFRPACMKSGEKYPVITWGNGTCGQSGGYASFLATVASHGFVVIAANSRFTDQGNNEMLKALDFAAAVNENPEHVLYQKLDLERVGAMGHSQGASATANAARDPRIQAVILWNGPVTADKPFLAVSGDRDIGGYTPQSMDSAVMGAAQPRAWLYYHQILETGGSVTGHLTLMEQPERVTEPTIAWWKYMLQGDTEAKKVFEGADCGLCGTPDAYEFGAYDLP